MSSAPTRRHDAPIIEPMSARVELDELYRLSTDDYHRLIESGAFDDFPPCELIDGLLVRKDTKSPAHENAVAWLLEWLMFGVDPNRFEVRVGAALSLDGSEPEPDLMVIERDVPRPYHPATATLAVEVSVSSLRRDLNRKAALYAQAGVQEYWVFDVGGRRVVVHRTPRAGTYTDVSELRAGGRITGAPAGLAELAIDDLVRATGS
jgi:Uma2 family endonuclease